MEQPIDQQAQEQELTQEQLSELLQVRRDKLSALQAAGRQVGVISHVQTLVERIGVQIKVQSLGGGESRIILP